MTNANPPHTNTVSPVSTRTSRALAWIAACSIAGTVAASPLVSAGQAQAEDIDTNPSANALQQQVENTAAAYDEALVAAQEADEALRDNEARIAELEALLPAQQARSDAAARELYKFQQQGTGVIDLVLSSGDFYEFLTNLDYVERITATNVEEIKRLNDMLGELEARQGDLARAQEDANLRVADAERALAAAQEARLEAQRQAQEAARQEAEAAAIARAATEASAAPSEGTAEQATVNAAVTEAAETAEATIDDGADWSSDEVAFVESWAGRIDGYLAGSPLAGQGRTFAQAAWNYGVDPRWSPAIAYTESSLGLYCFLPHNAWGWGSSSWGSWEEAINAHVQGLARGYGYTISMDAANKYCPPNAQHWYNTTLSQMNMI